MNVVDGLLALLLLLSALAGWRTGLLVRAASWAGLLLGLALAPLTVPLATELVPATTPTARLLVVVAAFVLTIGLASTVTGVIGTTLHRSVQDRGLSTVDQVLGVVGAVAGLLVTVWFLAPLAGSVPGASARLVRGSQIVRAVQEAAPPAPNPLVSLQSVLRSTRFPEVFADLAPAPTVEAPPGDVPVDDAVLARARDSTVKVEAVGCGATFAGSGWTVDDELVVTNAHVVSGADEVRVRRPDGTVLPATVLLHDDDRDLALLGVDGLDQVPLVLGRPRTGSGAATLGHPGGTDRVVVAPVAVGQTLEAVGRDIYGEDRTARQIVVLAAELAQGDSGSPVLDAAGDVVGVVFAISPDQPDTAYALAPSEVRAALAAPRDPGATGRCP